MHDQRLHKSPVIDIELLSVDDSDYYYPDWGCHVDFFAPRVEKLQAWP